jgi:NADH:ubiquinone oxidoreductase subunit F (NADH-binding)
VGRRPQLISNAETLACLALLARGQGAGTQLLTVRGAVRAEGVLEVRQGTTVREALELAGGVAEPLQALLVGGYFGKWVAAAEAMDAPLTIEGMRAVGGVLGAGIVMALPSRACGLSATAQVLAYLAAQSAGQCGPCLNGLPALAAAFTALADGTADPLVVQRIARLGEQVKGRGACAHPDGAVQLATSAVTVFAQDIQQHLGGSCGRYAGDALGVPA